MAASLCSITSNCCQEAGQHAERALAAGGPCSDACAVAKRPLVSGAAIGMDGQLTVYCLGDDGENIVE